MIRVLVLSVVVAGWRIIFLSTTSAVGVGVGVGVGFEEKWSFEYFYQYFQMMM